MRLSITPHRVALCKLVWILVRPPEWQEPPPPRALRQQLTLFLLKETQVRPRLQHTGVRPLVTHKSVWHASSRAAVLPTHSTEHRSLSFPPPPPSPLALHASLLVRCTPAGAP